MLGSQLPKVELTMRDAARGITGFGDFPVPHWKKI